MGIQNRVTVRCPLIVMNRARLSPSVTAIKFKLDRALPLNIGTIGLGPHLTVLFPDRSGQLVFPPLDERGKIIRSVEGEFQTRTYSLRDYDASRNELMIEFVNHPIGIGSHWVRCAKAGDKLGLITVNGKCLFQNEFLILIGDITAKSSFSYILSRLPAKAKGVVYLEVPHFQDKMTLSMPTGFKINWLIKNHQATQLPHAIKQLTLPEKSVPLVWGGMEGELARLIKKQLIAQFRFDKTRVQLIGYWLEGYSSGEFSHRGLRRDRD